MIRGFLYPMALLFVMAGLSFVVAFGLSMVADWNHYVRVMNWLEFDKPWDEFPIDPEESTIVRAERWNQQLEDRIGSQSSP